MGENFSSKLAHYLSSGCISPRYIVYQVLKYEKTVQKNKSTYWLIFELFLENTLYIIVNIMDLKFLKNML